MHFEGSADLHPLILNPAYFVALLEKQLRGGPSKPALSLVEQPTQ